MKHDAEQFPLPITDPTPDELREAEIQARWRRNLALHDEYWTDERRACLWAYGREDWPDSEPLYRRRSTVHTFVEERDRAERYGIKMRTVIEADAENERRYQAKKAIAERMAADIRAAFAAGKKCPYRMEPEYQWMLDWAIQLSCVPIESLNAGE